MLSFIAFFETILPSLFEIFKLFAVVWAAITGQFNIYG